VQRTRLAEEKTGDERRKRRAKEKRGRKGRINDKIGVKMRK